MPNLITHKIFGEDVLKLVSDPINDYVNKNPQAFSVGTSGPDYLFYNNMLPYQNQTEGRVVRNIGSLIHQKNINDWYTVAMKSIFKESDENTKSNMISFMIGHLTHFALDAIAHPFIFYQTGAKSSDHKYDHYRFESQLDTIMVKEYRKKDLRDYNSILMLSVDADIEDAVYKVYKDATEQAFDIDFKKSYVTSSYKDAHTILKVLYDPKNYKFKIIQILETIIRKKWLFSSHVVTNKVDTKHDVLNSNLNVWKHPCDSSITSQKSFLDLYYEALDYCVEVLNAFEKALETKDLSQLMSVIDNKSYETGLSEYQEMTTYKSIYD